MKNTILLAISLLAITSFANPIVADGKFGSDSLECVKNRSVCAQFIKQKNYSDAVSPWRWTYLNCPKSSKDIYVYGSTIFKYLIKNAKDKQLKEALIDSLMNMYDQRISLFGQEGYVMGLKGSDMLKLQPNNLEEAFILLKKSVEIQGKKSRATDLNSYFKAATEKFEAGTFATSDVIEVYSTVADYIDYNINNKEGKKQKPYIQAAEKVEKLFFLNFANCEELVALFDAKYAESPDDLVLLKRITKDLGKKECTDASVYFTAAAKLHEVDPNAFSAYSMGDLSIKKNKFSDAVVYYKQALEMADKEEDKADYYYGLAEAYFKLGSLKTARSNAYKAIELKANWGKPYILIGEIYAATRGEKSCCKNEFEQKLIYSLAIDKFVKAKNVDPSFNETASKRIAKYSVYLPTAQDVFWQEDKQITEGSLYPFGCWINESTKVRLK